MLLLNKMQRNYFTIIIINVVIKMTLMAALRGFCLNKNKKFTTFRAFIMSLLRNVLPTKCKAQKQVPLVNNDHH